MWSIHKKQRRNWKVHANWKYKLYLIYKIGLDKACFQEDKAYGKSKDLLKRTQSDKVLRNKAFKITSDPKHDGYQRGLTSMVYKIFDKKSASLNRSSGSGIVNEANYQLAMNFINQLSENLEK